ncbi:MAG: MFS transporter [Myxococcales bacterium]|jgi:MFS family permease|nr:MFS transporter [Myxococcales bacterium]
MIRHPIAILVLLTGLNLLNYLDRLIVAAVLPKITDELKLSNLVGGLLATIFLLGYFVASPVFGSLGDRRARKGLIALGVALWSIATFASGLATTAGGLLVARAFVGIGEASYATIAPTIIDDVTPPEKKGRWLAVFYVASPVGAALGYLVGGFIEKHWGWRTAFFVAGGPGLLLAATCLLIDEPPRKVMKEKINLLQSALVLVKIPLYRRAVLGYCAYTAAIGAFSHWAPTFLYRRYALGLSTANFFFGLITVLAGAAGTAIGGAWADRAQAGLPRADTAKPPEGEAPYRDESPERQGERIDRAEVVRNKLAVNVLLRVCAIGAAVGAPLAALCFLSPAPKAFFGVAAVCEVFLFLSTSPINAVILRAVPPQLRASAMALSIFAIHLFGDLWSPALVGLLADHLPVAIAMMALPAFIALSAFLWWPRAREAT